MEDNSNLENIKKKQVEDIKECIKKIVNDDKEYYKDKKYAKKFLINGN